jgi:hypothetical protein
MSTDQRRGVRYEVRLPCQVSSPGKVFGDLMGVTHDMSRLGLLLELEQKGFPDRYPKVGQAARILLELPRRASEKRCIECLGRVVRVDREALAVAFEFRRVIFTGEYPPFDPALGT